MPNLHTLHPERQFTQVSHEAADQLPSMNGLGYLVHLLRHRDGYLPNLDKLVEQKPGVTRRDASKARAEVMEHGFYVSVRFKHSGGGQFETDIWRSVYPHTAEDLDEIAQRYQPGNVTQIAQKGAGKKVQRDAHGNVLMRQVTIKWARVDSWRGQQRVGDSGQLCAPTTDTNASPVADTSTHNGGAGSGNSARPAKTNESPGGAEVPDSGGSGTRGVGEREVLRTPPAYTTGEHQPTSAASDESSPAVADSSGDGWLGNEQEQNDERVSGPSESSTAATGVDQQAGTAGAQLLRDLRGADGSSLNADAVRDYRAQVDGYLEAGHTERQISRFLTGDGTARTAGFIRSKLDKLAAGEERLPEAPVVCAQDATARAHFEVTRMAKQREQGAREAAGLLGTTWQEPDRGDLGAREYLTEVVPAAAREFVERHREHLVTALVSPRQVVAA